MPSFVLTGTSTTAQTLGSAETGFIGVNGALVVSTADAISGTGVNSLTILGRWSTRVFSSPARLMISTEPVPRFWSGPPALSSRIQSAFLPARPRSFC